MKRALVAICLTLFGCVLSSPAHAQSPSVQSADEAEIRAAIQTQSDAWNRADIPAFMQTYEDSPDHLHRAEATQGLPAHPAAISAELHLARADGNSDLFEYRNPPTPIRLRQI